MSKQPRIDFYVLAQAQGRLMFACRLLEKAYHSGSRVYVHADDATTARAFDQMLWEYRDGSFVPHTLYTPEQSDADPYTPIRIGWQTPPLDIASVLLNLAQTLAPDYQQFKRVLEIVDRDPGHLDASRRRFQAYRDAGLEPDTIEINST